MYSINLRCERFVPIFQDVSNPHFKSAVKTLTVCTQHNQTAREAILKHEKGIPTVVDVAVASNNHKNASLMLI